MNGSNRWQWRSVPRRESEPSGNLLTPAEHVRVYSARVQHRVSFSAIAKDEALEQDDLDDGAHDESDVDENAHGCHPPDIGQGKDDLGEDDPAGDGE